MMLAEPLLAVLLVGVSVLLLRVSRSSVGQLAGVAGAAAGVYLLGQGYLPAEVGDGGDATPTFAAHGGWTAFGGVALGLGLLALIGFHLSGPWRRVASPGASTRSPVRRDRASSRHALPMSRSAHPSDPTRPAGD